MLSQQTLRNPISASGIGLHTGNRVHLTVRKGNEDSGIRFIRTDLNPTVTIPARIQSVVDSELATTIGSGQYSVSTIEHLMAAFAGLGVDNAIVEVNGPEIPIMDGSAAPFVFLIQSAGLLRQNAPKRFIKILKPIVFDDSRQEVHVELLPCDSFHLDYQIEYQHPVFSGLKERSSIHFSKSGFIKELSRARTFGFLADYDRLKSMNLALGGSLDNTVVIGDSEILNKGKLRLKDEFAKHKMLDAIGDLYLVGHNMIGAFVGIRSGHSSNHNLLRTLLNRPDCWDYVTFEDTSRISPSYRGFYDDIDEFWEEDLPVAV